MAFWSGEKLEQRLPSIIQNYDVNCIDCASYILHLGEQVFVTRDEFSKGDSAAPLTQVLKDNPPENTVIIYPGQFAFLLTHETVEIPNDVLAFISMKAGFKFKGLVNVSGFHVDPGFSGKLIFGVYNAGPKEIILEKNQPLFLIVFADLDRPSRKTYQGIANNRNKIDTNLIQGMATGQVFSPMMLKRQMKELDSMQRIISNEIASIKTRGGVWDAISIGFIGIFVAALIGLAALDSCKIIFGGLIKNSIVAYDEYLIKEKDKLSSPLIPDPTKIPTSDNTKLDIPVAQPRK